MGTHFSPQKGATAALTFRLLYCDQTAGWIKMPLGAEVGLVPGHVLLVGDPAPPQKRGHSPQCSAHVCYGQTARWIKMSLGMKVGVGPGDIVFDGDPAPPLKGAQPPPPIFSPCLLWSDSWIDQDATWYRGRPQTRQHCVTWGPSFPLKRGIAPPVFSAHIYCGDSAGNTVAKNSSVFSLIRMH